MTRTRFGTLGFTLLVLLAPLASDGTPFETNNCSRATSSLAASVEGPTKGDEAFFSSAGLSSAGTAGVVFLLDNSGSMKSLPQCNNGGGGGGGGGGGSMSCSAPSISNPADPSGTNLLPVVSGSCDFSSDTQRRWMTGGETSAALKSLNVTAPNLTAFADPGYDYGAGWVKDSPPWSQGGIWTGVGSDPVAPGCVANDNCLFDPNGYYDWTNNNPWTETTATKVKGDPCALVDNAGVTKKDKNNVLLTAGTACSDCFKSKGIYAFKVRYYSGTNNGNPTFTTETGRFLARGTWLNANPPKFVAARRAVKQLVKIDPSNKQARDFARYGLTTFWDQGYKSDGTWDTSQDTGNDGDTGGIKTGDGARLIVPLGPDCDGESPATSLTKHVQNRQAIVDALNNKNARTATDIGVIKFSSSTPLAESLFNIMQYFSGGGASGIHHQAFGGGLAFPSLWDKVGYATNPKPSTPKYDSGADFSETSPGAVNAAWVTAANLVTPSKQSSMCYHCQVSAAIIVTDGAPNNESGLPFANVSAHSTMPQDANQAPNYNGKWDFQTWTPAEYKTACGGNFGKTGDTCKSYLPLVALYGSSFDFRTGTHPYTLDAMAGVQNVFTHTVSFGTRDATAQKVLSATATLGKGKWYDTSSATELENALVSSVNSVVQRATSFSASSANALQTSRNSSTETFFARFKPGNGLAWEGHLIQAFLFDEFAQGCDSTIGPTQTPIACGVNGTANPNFNLDVDAAGHNICTGVFLVDDNCKEIAEDKNGEFVLIDGATPATLAWDAGKALSTPGSSAYRSAAEADATGVTARKIMTCVADPASAAATGTTSCTMTDFTVANVSLLSPTMGLDQTFCAKLLADSQFCTTCPAAGSLTAADLTSCAKLVIRYVRGWDVMDSNSNGCRGPENTVATICDGKGEQRDDVDGKKTLWKLGDVFHSTPAVVKPPLDELRCDLGYEAQCVSTIHSPTGLAHQTPYDTYTGATSGSTVDAYERWRLDHKDRTRVVLAGANDGMLHAFNAGDAITSKTPEPLTGVYPYDQGNAAEEWAFIPPDLLPRLKYLLYGHQYLVDGSTMLRDIWVDGSNQTTATIGGKDGTKQKTEFHTLAVITERSGGTQYTALDVTDVKSPKYLWTFPPPGSDDARYMAQSWSDFAPRPPPIGPVRISTGTNTFEERWVVMINGGYDPALVKGRAIFMVDVWTGKTLWRFTNDDFKDMQTGSATASMFPVPAGVALIDLGDITKPAFDGDGFFDTATWGDMGGQLWVARFFEPGTLDPTTGLATNWFAARTFEQQRRTDGVQSMRADGSTGPGQFRSEFFYMTTNAFESTSRTLRTFLGSGNREQMLEAAASPGCGPDNLLSCLRAGCSSVTTQTVDNFGACANTASFSYAAGVMTQNKSTTTCATLPATCAPAAGTPFTSNTTFDFTCGGTAAAQIKVGLTCDASGLCTYKNLDSFGANVGTSYVAPALLTASQNHSRFYGMWAYGKDAKKMFDDPDPVNALKAAKDFDANRFTDVAYSGSCAGPAGGTCTLVDSTQALVTYDATGKTAAVTTSCGGGATKCSAKVEDAGWFYQYGVNCPISVCDPAPPWADEKTAAGANLVLGCAAWSGFRPIGSNTTVGGPCDVAIGNPTSYSYMSDFVTGTPSQACGWSDSGVIRRANERPTWSPPSAPTVRVTINDKGQINYSTLQLDPGAPPGQKTIGSRTDVTESVYWLEVPRRLHNCRHVDAHSCE